MLAQLTFICLFAFADSAEQAHVPYHDLGVQFVDALKRDDIIAYAHCWMPVPRIQALALAARLAGKQTLSKEEIEDHYRTRNEQVANSFHILKEYLNKHGKLEDARLVEVSPVNKRERDGINSIGLVIIKIELAQQQFVVTIDDALEDDGKWFFTDKPIRIIGPDKKVVSLQKSENKANPDIPIAPVSPK